MKKGLTLIELAVVIGIVLLLVFDVLTGLSMSRQRREVKTTAEKLKSMILEARSRAMNPSDDAYGLKEVDIRINKGTPYDVSIIEVYLDNSEDTIQEFLPPNSVRITPAIVGSNIDLHPGGSHYYFSFEARNDKNQLGQIDHLIGGSTSAAIEISDTSDEEKYILTVYGITGNVDIEKGT